MKTLDVINNVYLPVLNSLYLEADQETGKVQIAYDWDDGVRVPVSIKEKTLHLPIDSALKGDNNDVIFFHPLAENVARGDSAVFKTLKIYATTAMTYAISNLAYGLMYLALRKDLHDGLNANQTKILQILPEVDEKTLKALVKFNESIDLMDERLVSVFTRRAGVYKGETYNRVTYISFPMLCDLLDRKTPAKVKNMRKSDFDKLLAVFSYIVPNFNESKEQNAYSAKSSSMYAPNFQSLMVAYINVMENVQKLFNTYKTAFKKVPELEPLNNFIFDLKTLHEVTDMDKYANLIPVLEGNEGPVNARETKLGMEQTQRPKAVPPTNAMSKVKLDMNNQQFSPQQVGNSFDQNQQNAQNNQNNQPQNTGFVTPEQFNQLQQQQQQQQMQNNNQGFNGNGNGFNNNGAGFNNGFNNGFNGNMNQNTQRKSCVGGPTQANVMGNYAHGNGFNSGGFNNGFGNGFNNNGFGNNGFQNNAGFGNGFQNNGGFSGGFNTGFNNNGFGNGFNNNPQQTSVNPNDALATWNQGVNNEQQMQAMAQFQNQQQQMQQYMTMMQQMQQQQMQNNNQGFNTFNGFGGGQQGGFGGGFKTK